MSLQRGIQQFLDGMDSTILARGKDYYRSGQVESIDWDKNHVTAEVSGSEEELYLVELNFSQDGGIEAWSCDYPYDWGPVCKHTAAVLLAIQADPPEEFSKNIQSSKIDFRPLLGKAKRAQLGGGGRSRLTRPVSWPCWGTGSFTKLRRAFWRRMAAGRRCIRNSSRS